MLILGVTGGIGSGKTAVTNIFSKLDVDIIDADLASRKAVLKGSPLLKKIKEKFGKNILLQDGNLNRAKLREIIFKEKKQKVQIQIKKCKMQKMNWKKLKMR